MLDVLRITAGLALVVVALVEILVTTISVSGVQGPLTSRLTSSAWKGLRWLSDRRGMQRVLLASGPLMVLATFLLWVLLAVLGWGLVFSSDGAVQARGDTSLTPWDPFFYAAGQILGQGGPDVGASEVLWKAAEQVLALNGVALLSLGLAWIIPVVGAVVRTRQVATRMYLLGATPDEVVQRAREDGDLGDLHLYLNGIADDLTDLSHRQFAFPVVQYFFTTDLRASIQPRLAILTEATFLLAAQDDPEIHPGVLRHYWRAVEDYLGRMTQRFASASSDAPDDPGAHRVDDTLAEEGRVTAVQDEHDELRRMLAGTMAFAGWRWEQTVARDPADAEASEDERRS